MGIRFVGRQTGTFPIVRRVTTRDIRAILLCVVVRERVMFKTWDVLLRPVPPLVLHHIVVSQMVVVAIVLVVMWEIIVRLGISVTRVVEHRHVTTRTQIHVVVGIGRRLVLPATNVVHIFLLGALGVPVVQLLLLGLELEPVVRTVELMIVRG